MSLNQNCVLVTHILQTRQFISEFGHLCATEVLAFSVMVGLQRFVIKWKFVLCMIFSRSPTFAENLYLLCGLTLTLSLGIVAFVF
jgi:hypothetical protein